MRLASALLALAACAPEASLRADGPVGAQTELLIRLDDAGAPRSITLRPAADTAPLWLVGDDTFVVLSYDRPPEQLGRLDGGFGEVPTPSDPAESWPLPAPLGAWTLDAGERHELGELPAAISALRVPRPPCAEPYRAIPLGGERLSTGSGVIAVRGGAVLAVEDDGVGEVFFVSTATGGTYRLKLEDERAAGGAPRLFRDDRGAWLLWPSADFTLDLYALDGHDLRVDRLPRAARTLRTAELARWTVEALASASVAGRRVLLARGYTRESGVRVTAFARLDEGADTWAPIFGPQPPLDCDQGVGAQVLTLEPDGTGLAGVERDTIRRFELRAPSALGAPAFIRSNLCRSALARHASGAELLLYYAFGANSGNGYEPGLAWRWPGGEWQGPIDAPSSLGGGVIAVGDTILAGGAPGVLLRYELDPTRPELPPRACSPIPVASLRALYFAELEDGSILATGTQNLPARLLPHR